MLASAPPTEAGSSSPIDACRQVRADGWPCEQEAAHQRAAERQLATGRIGHTRPDQRRLAVWMKRAASVSK